MRNNANRLILFLGGIALLWGCCGISNAATPMVSAGIDYAIALKADGTISAWGRNDYGQLGNGQLAMRATPGKVDGIDRITAVATGSGSTLALRDDGTVWGWGNNASGQLGDGTLQNKSHPVPVTGLVGAVKSVATTFGHALAITTDGGVWAWGWGLYGQLGNGATDSSLSATKVSGLPAVVDKVATGTQHSLALAGDGSVWAWGDNSNGQLGDGSTNPSLTPIRVEALSNIVAISTYAKSNLALDTSDRVWAWGYGNRGALGDGSYSDRTTPFVVPGLPQIKAIAAGNFVSIAIAADGSVWMWGDNEFGQFGDSTFSKQPSPVKILILTGFSGFSVGDRDVVARSLDGALQAWGVNDYGQLGVGDAIDRSIPTLVSTPAQFTQVSAGLSHSAAVAGDGSVWAWGTNGGGELADGTASVSNRPVAVQGTGDTVAVSAGRFHALSLSGNGSVWAWGNNINGALGNGSRRDSSLPQLIPALPAMSAIAGGYGFSLALEQSGSVWSWGYNGEGQLGKGLAGLSQLTPEKLTTISGVSQLSAYLHVLAVRQDGSVWAWGANSYGQLGDGSTTNQSIPTRVTSLTNEVNAVAAGGFHSLALDRSGNVWAWGYNWDGQLGDGTTADQHIPVRVIGLSDVAAISAGENSSYAITRDGRLWAWGWNREGELGTGSLDSWSSLAHPIEELVGFQGIAGGFGSAVALRSDGTVWAWGRNFEGQLGDATFAQRNTPVLTVNATVDGPLDLNPQVVNSIPPDRIPPFFATTDRAGDLSRFSLSTTTKFNAADVGNSGAVYVTAMVPSGSLVPAQSSMSAAGAFSRGATAATAASPYVLIQLTPSSGWQQVVNGQLIPYATGVLGDQLAAQTILNNTDTTNLNGAQFCVGYGTSPNQMIAAGTMRAVATIPDPNATGVGTVSCIAGIPLSYTLLVPPGWNLLGNSLNQTLSVASMFSDPSTVTTVWKWDAVNAGWQFYAPSMDTPTLQTYATSKGYGVLSVINPGEGYWVNAKAQPTLGTQSGNAFNLTAANLVAGWNLVATGNDVMPSAFNASLNAIPPAVGVSTLWAWNNPSSQWHFYAPSLDANGTLSAYVAGKGYLDFDAKTLGNGTGFWVNKP